MHRPPALTDQRWALGGGFLASVRWRHLVIMLRVLLFVALASVTLMALSGGTPEWLARSDDGGSGTLLAACLLYALCLSVPFVPSVEIGLLIMVVFGKTGAVGAYLATLVGLNLAYGVGRVLGSGIDVGRLHLPVGAGARLQRLARHLPSGSLPALALALLLNLPANTALGGGGGIGLIYGATRTLHWPAFAATVAVATAVVPMLFLGGVVSAERFLAAH